MRKLKIVGGKAVMEAEQKIEILNEIIFDITGDCGFVLEKNKPEHKPFATKCWDCGKHIEMNQKYCEKCGVEL